MYNNEVTETCVIHVQSCYTCDLCFSLAVPVNRLKRVYVCSVVCFSLTVPVNRLKPVLYMFSYVTLVICVSVSLSIVNRLKPVLCVFSRVTLVICVLV